MVSESDTNEGDQELDQVEDEDVKLRIVLQY